MQNVKKMRAKSEYLRCSIYLKDRLSRTELKYLTCLHQLELLYNCHTPFVLVFRRLEKIRKISGNADYRKDITSQFDIKVI